MKRLVCFCLLCTMLIQAFPLSVFSFESDKNGYVKNVSFKDFSLALDDSNHIYKKGKVFVSKDGKYGYYIDKDTNEASFVEAFEPDITVIEIPEEIDGYNVTSVSYMMSKSPSALRVKFADSIKYVCKYGFSSYPQKPLPLCTVNINEGVVSIAENVWATRSDLLNCKVLILPKSLEYIGEEGLNRGFSENIIFQSNPFTEKNSATILMYEEMEGAEYLINNELPFDGHTNYYFTDDATNLSEFTFNTFPRLFDEELVMPLTFPVRNVTIYKKAGALGFEKFLENYYDEAVNKFGMATYGIEIPEYTVKEYTEEWWHDLAEIEEVTMTAEGMSEKTEQVGNGLSDSARKYLSHEYEKSVKSGEKFTVSSAFAPSDAYDDRTFFVSMDETVATVDTETGEVTALKKGTARIRCVAASGVFSDCILKVDGGGLSNGMDTFDEKKVFDGGISFDYLEAYVKLNKTKFIVAAVCVVAAAAILTAAVIVIKKKKR